jgi:hypothetical protein
MALTKTTTIDKIEIVGEYKHIQVREANIIHEDDVELTRSFNRYVLTPGQDISNQTLEIQTIASAIWTEDLIERYNQSVLNNINP